MSEQPIKTAPDQGDQWRTLRDRSGRAPETSWATDCAAAALGCGFELYGLKEEQGETKAYLDETWIDGATQKPRRQITFSFQAGGSIELEPIRSRVETVPLSEVWERLRNRAWLEANLHHPLTWIHCAHLQRFQLSRKLVAGRIQPRPSLCDDLPAVETCEGDPLLELGDPEPCPDPDRPVVFRPIERKETIDIRTFLLRWRDEDWIEANPHHPLSWSVRSFRGDAFPVPTISPPPGTPIGIPLERHIAIVRGASRSVRRTWIPQRLTKDQRREVLAKLTKKKKR